MRHLAMMPHHLTYHILCPGNAALLDGTDVFDNPVDPAQFAAFLADPLHDLVFAMAGLKVVGMARGTVLLHPDKPPAFFINEVGVNEDMRRLGIATALCDRLMRLARGRGCGTIWVATEPDNTEANALYRRLAGAGPVPVVMYEWEDPART